MDSQVLAEIIGRIIGGMLAVALFWVLPIVGGIRIARRKGRSPHWMWFGIHPAGGWITLLVLALVSARKACPACAETIPARARLCSYCGHQFASTAPAAGIFASDAPAQPFSQPQPVER